MVICQKKQGSDLIDLRLIWREMENFIFGCFLRIFGDILENFRRIFEELGEIGSLLEEED